MLSSSYGRTASLQNARDAAKSKGEQNQGHPQGKRRDALLRLLLWRVAQLITDEAVKTAQDLGEQVLLNLRAVGMQARPLQTCGQQGASLSQLTTITLHGCGLLRADLGFGAIWHRNRGGYGANEQAGQIRLKALE